MREFPFPEDLGPFVSENLIWNRMALRYRSRYVNEVIAVKEYQPDGLTASWQSRNIRSSRASLVYYGEYLAGGWSLPPRLTLQTYANYVRHALHERMGPARQLADVPSRGWWSLAAPIGLVLYLRDRRELRRQPLA